MSNVVTCCVVTDGKLRQKEWDSRIILVMVSTNEGRRYTVASFPIGGVHTQNEPYIHNSQLF